MEWVCMGGLVSGLLGDLLGGWVFCVVGRMSGLRRGLLGGCLG